jgi:hypothetical protein
MRLSEAIRLGAAISPQTAGRFFEKGKSCALGSAALAIGIKETNDVDQCVAVMYALRIAFPVLSNTNVPCPACAHLLANLSSAVAHLNDNHSWTREKIADYVEFIENAQQETAPVEEPVAVHA